MRRRFYRFRSPLALATLLALLALTFGAGCSMIHGSAQMNSDLRPHFGLGADIPLGGK